MCVCVRSRFGRVHSTILALASMWQLILTNAGELAFAAASAELLCPQLPRALVIGSIQCVAGIYSTVFGLRASLITDLMQAPLVIIMLILLLPSTWNAAVVAGPHLQPLLQWTSPGVVSGFTMIFSFSPAFLIDQSVWQRAARAPSKSSLRLGLAFASMLLFPLISYAGVGGILAAAANRAREASDSAGVAPVPSEFLEEAPLLSLAVLEGGNKALCCALFGGVILLTLSSSDAIQTGIHCLLVSLACGGTSVQLEKSSKEKRTALRFAGLCLQLPSVFLALWWSDSVIILFLIANFFSSAVLVPFLLGMWNRTNWLVAALGPFVGLLAVPFCGVVFSGSAERFLLWFTLPEGPEAAVSTVTFIAVPIVAGLFTVVGSLVFPAKGPFASPEHAKKGVELQANPNSIDV